MADAALSQSEIDDLLASLMSESPEEAAPVKDDGEEIKPYDFRSAARFPKDQIRTLRNVFSTFAQLLANKITGTLRVSCECELYDVQEMPFNEMNNSMPSPAVIAIMSNEPMEGTQLMVLTPDLGYMIVSRVLGGVDTGKTDTSKQFTEIELAILERLMTEIMSVFQDAWKKVIGVKTRLERMETNPQFAQIVPSSEPMAMITLQVKMGEEEGMMLIGLPHSSIEPIGKQMTMRLMNTGYGKRTDEKMSQQIRRNLIHANVLLTTYFDDTPMTVRDIMRLRVGQEIPLNHKLAEPLKMRVQHIPKFRVQYGTNPEQTKYAVKLIDIIKEDNGE